MLVSGAMLAILVPQFRTKDFGMMDEGCGLPGLQGLSFGVVPVVKGPRCVDLSGVKL